jgi:hypothetical protein
MAWTYDLTQLAIPVPPTVPADLATWTLPRIRALIGDTMTKDQQMQDEELAFFMSQKTSIYGAAALACRSLAAQMSRQADSTQGNLHTLYSNRARAYAAAAARFEIDEVTRSAGMPYSGQTSRTDYDNRDQDEDRMGPEFEIGGDENRQIAPLRRQVR